MSIAAPKYFSYPAKEDMKTAKPVSSLRIGTKMMLGANHLLGHVLGGLRVGTTAGSQPAFHDDTYRFYVYRHPNCDWLDVFFRVWTPKDFTHPSTVPWTVAIKAGSGTTVTYGPSYDSQSAGKLYLARCPWGATSGYAEVTVTVTDVALRGIWAIDLPRYNAVHGLDVGDSYLDQIERTDGGHVGILEGWHLATSDEAGPDGMVGRVYDTWDYFRPQLLSWSDPTGQAVSAPSFVNYISFQSYGRQKRSEATRLSRWWLRSRCISGVTYDLRVKSSVASTLITGLTNSTSAWQTSMTLSIGAAGYDTIEIAGRVTAGGPANVYLEAASGIGE